MWVGLSVSWKVVQSRSHTCLLCSPCLSGLYLPSFLPCSHPHRAPSLPLSPSECEDWTNERMNEWIGWSMPAQPFSRPWPSFFSSFTCFIHQLHQLHPPRFSSRHLYLSETRYPTNSALIEYTSTTLNSHSNSNPLPNPKYTCQKKREKKKKWKISCLLQNRQKWWQNTKKNLREFFSSFMIHVQKQ